MLNNKGFTLIEILVSIVIISLVGIVFFPNFRKFNTDQQYRNEVLNLQNDIKKAQTMFASGTRCTANKATLGWSLTITNGNPVTSNLKGYCINSSLVQSNEPLASVPLPSTAIQSSTCPTNTTIELKFDRQGFSYSCNGGAFISGTFTLQLQNKASTTQSTTFTINPVGTILQN